MSWIKWTGDGVVCLKSRIQVYWWLFSLAFTIDIGPAASFVYSSSEVLCFWWYNCIWFVTSHYDLFDVFHPPSLQLKHDTSSFEISYFFSSLNRVYVKRTQLWLKAKKIWYFDLFLQTRNMKEPGSRMRNLAWMIWIHRPQMLLTTTSFVIPLVILMRKFCCNLIVLLEHWYAFYCSLFPGCFTDL